VVGYRYDTLELAFFNDLTVGIGPNGTEPFEARSFTAAHDASW
jgi:hypothetical protein